MEHISNSCLESIEIESRSPDSLPELLTDMECIKINSSSSSSPSTSSPSPTNQFSRRSNRSSTKTATENVEKLHKIKRRTIAKPRRLDPSTLAADASESLIKKLYLNKKMTKLNPTSLETIWEEPKIKNHEISYISGQKFKRSIKFKDHMSISKQTIQTRRKRIKRLLGSAHKLKKISMDAFMNHLKLMSQNETTDE
uniref:CSON002944 protein n=1 Tax=Culicoides sonorensis TaxID=179676 RepID=A0A336JYS1_CULSO